MADCAKAGEKTDSNTLVKQGDIIQKKEGFTYDFFTQKLEISSQNIFKQAFGSSIHYHSAQFEESGEDFGLIASKVYRQALLSPEFCVCDNTFEFMIGFTNQIIPKIDARNLLHSLQTKSAAF